jgi:hypothetical protein
MAFFEAEIGKSREELNFSQLAQGLLEFIPEISNKRKDQTRALIARSELQKLFKKRCLSSARSSHDELSATIRLQDGLNCVLEFFLHICGRKHRSPFIIRKLYRLALYCRSLGDIITLAAGLSPT